MSETTTREWWELRDDSEQSWEMAVDTCHDCDGVIDEARQAECREAMDSAMGAWDRALAATDAEERDEALEEARALAAEWGDDSRERAALRLLAPVTVEVVEVHTGHGEDMDCPPDCEDSAHDVRTVYLRVAVGDESGEASALFARDPVNGGWQHVGDSIDGWYWSDMEDDRLTRLVCDYIGGGARVGDRYVSTMGADGQRDVAVEEVARG